MNYIIRHFTFSVLALALLITSCAPSGETAQSGNTAEQQEQLIELIQNMPAANQAEHAWLNEQILKMGDSALHTLAGMLTAPGNGDDTYARYALNGLAKHVSEAGADTERADFENVILQELDADHAAPAKAFLMEQLELIGSDEAVDRLHAFIGSDALNESAVHALRAIDTPLAHQVLLEELSNVNEDQRIVIIKALGDMRVASVAENLRPYSSSDNIQLRHAALYTLARSGSPTAGDLIREFGTADDNLHFARRLAEEGHGELSSEICHRFLGDDHPVQAQTSALSILVQLGKEQAMDELMNMARSSNHELRSAALQLTNKLDAPTVTGELVNRLKEGKAAVQADIITTLGKRGDRSALEAIRPFLQDEHMNVRIAAIISVASLDGTEAIPDLLEILNHSDDTDEQSAAKRALLQLPTRPLLQAVKEALPSASETGKVAMIEILAERRGTEYLEGVLNQADGPPPVRMAVFGSLSKLATPEDLTRLIELIQDTRSDEEYKAIQDAVTEISKSGNHSEIIVQALENAPDSRKPALLELLSRIGGEQALNAVAASAENENDAVKNAAFRALASWPDASAIQPLLAAFDHASASDRRVMLGGYIRVVLESNYSSEDKVEFFGKAIEHATSNEERLRLIQALSEVHSPVSLKMIAGYFTSGNHSIRNQALHSAAEILAPHYDPISSSFNTASATFAILESTTGAEFRNNIEQEIQKIIAQKESRKGFEPLSNGRDLSGWSGDLEEYMVENNQIIHKSGASGRIFTGRQFSDFILRFEFKLTPGANNGLAIRSPLKGDPAYTGMEIQILDNTAVKYADLEPYQYHGSIYGVAAAERGHLRAAGEWNSQEVIADGSHITVKLNGATILDTDIKEAGTPTTLDGKDHPGLHRDRGHIGFLGHGDEVAFRNIHIRNLNEYSPTYSFGNENENGMNTPPEGFTALFNGENLKGWKGLVENPEVRAEMTPEKLSNAQAKADSAMRKHWSVRNGVLYFDGKGESLTTDKEYRNFEMLVDWKIEPHGDSGIYLRGSPQVQIWDITENPVGSGGLYNNQKHQSDPSVPADNAIGEWNHMRIKMISERVTVHLNGELVVPGVVMENYWNRDIPIYPEGQIELQAHNTPLYFRNIFIKEIPRPEPLFNGNDLSGWEQVGGESQSESQWHADDGILYTEGGSGWLSTTGQYDNFKLELEYRLPEGGNSGIFLRAPREGNPAYQGLEIQLLDDHSPKYADLEPWQFTGSIYDVKAPSQKAAKRAGEWQQMAIIADGPRLKVILNEEIITNTSLIHFMHRVNEHPGLKRRKGYIGLQNHNSRVEFRNIKITEIK